MFFCGLLNSQSYQDFFDNLDENSPNYDFISNAWFQLCENVPYSTIQHFFTAIDETITWNLEDGINRNEDRKNALKNLTKKDLLELEPILSFIAGMAYADMQWKKKLEGADEKGK